MGGQGREGALSDVWSLTSGSMTWTQLTAVAAFGALYGSGISAIQSGPQIILAGGETSSGLTTAVWSGVYTFGSTAPTWYQLTSSPGWTARTVSMVSTTDDDLYAIVGPCVASTPLANDVSNTCRATGPGHARCAGRC